MNVSGSPTGSVDMDKMFDVKGADTTKELANEKATANEAFMRECSEKTNPFVKLKESRKPSKARYGKVQGAMQGAEKQKRLIPLKQIKDTAGQYQQKNPELKGKMLLLLREYIKPDDSPADIIAKVKEFYEDPSLADEAMDFLIDTSEGQLNVNIQDAKGTHGAEFQREITAGKNIGAAAREAADKGLGTPTSLRDLYRDITGNPREATTLFAELANKYEYKDMKKVVKFLMHSLGTDLNSGGPSIERGLLHNLVTEAKTLQAILGVYKFFEGRMDLVKKQFSKEEIPLPPNLTFETMAKQFMEFVADRYPSSDKALQVTTKLGIKESIPAKIFTLSSLRDAIPQVSAGKVFKSYQHLDDCKGAIGHALEDLEDDLEELQEKQQEERGGRPPDVAAAA